jgi:hypothetical protein
MSPVSAVLSIRVDSSVLAEIHAGYECDEFCKKVISNGVSVPGISEANGLWYIGGHLLIPRCNTSSDPACEL